MELELTRVDYTIVGVVLQHSMRLLPTQKFKDQQKIVIGDQSGVVQLLSVKKDELHVHFKTVPGLKITAIQLGGAAGAIADKIFVAYENEVIGYNKKGKVFLTFDTNLTEPIKSMFVSGSDLIVCGNHLMTHYKDCKESGSYLCGDTITDCICICPHNTSRIITVLACSGRVLRLLEHCRVRKLIELESFPTVLYVPKAAIGDKLLVGFSDGRVILYRINAMLTDVKQEVLVDTKDNTSAVTCLDSYDLLADGKDELIVGRRDGTIQVYTMMLENNEFLMDCQQIYSENFNESISSVQGGCIGSSGYTEIIAATYSGKLFGLTTQTIGDSIGDKNIDMIADANQRIAKLKGEVDGLEAAVNKEREKYQMSTQAISSGLSAIPMLPINDTMMLCPDDCSYVISLEIPAAIEHILIQCDVAIEMQDVEKNTAVVSFSECDPTEGNQILATYRCQMNTNRVDLKFRTLEGQYGTLQVYVTPNIQPKCCQLRTYSIRPLSLHMIVQSYDETRPMNTLALKGNFSQGEMHNWISNCISEVPEKFPNKDDGPLVFKNAFVGTYLTCKYSRGEAEFGTDNISTMAILKDFLTKEATKKHIKLEITTNINETTVENMIKLIEPQITSHNTLVQNYKLLQALIDLNVQNDDEFNLLSDKYKNLLTNKNIIETSYKNEGSNLQRLNGIMTDLYIDKHKFKGINVKSKIEQLSELLKNFNYDELIRFYTAGDNKNDD